LYKLGIAVECSDDERKEIYVCAAKDNAANGAVLIVNRNAVGQSVKLEVAGAESKPKKCRILDKSRLLEGASCLSEGVLSLPPQSVILLSWVF